jgi:hypothetical protein
MQKFLKIMYYIQFHEIEAYYQYDLKKLKDENIENSTIVEILNIIKSFDVDKFFNNLHKDDLDRLIYYYYKLKSETFNSPKLSILGSVKNFIQDFFGIDTAEKVKVPDQEVKNFVTKMKNQIEYNKKLYAKYLGKLKMVKLDTEINSEKI